MVQSQDEVLWTRTYIPEHKERWAILCCSSLNISSLLLLTANLFKNLSLSWSSGRNF